MRKQTRDNLFNLGELATVWVLFWIWCWFTGSRLLSVSQLAAGLGSALASLLFLQYLAGVIHEAAHGNFIQEHFSANDHVANWFAAYVFGYSVSSFRTQHFEHHA